MKVLVTGASGQLGHDVVRELQKRKIEVICADRSGGGGVGCINVKLDITDSDMVNDVLLSVKPDVVIHCAAWTNVDAAEDPENINVVKAVNVDGTANLVRVAKIIDAKFLYVSTDYVFSGDGEEPWPADCEEYAPLNIYGQSKLGGELEEKKNLEKYFIVRIAWVFGKNGKNFVDTMLKIGRNHDVVKVVADQIGTPAYTVDLAKLMVDMIETDKYGCYHATNEGGFVSWAEFAKEIFRLAGMKTRVEDITTAEYENQIGKMVARRPFNSRLDKKKLVENGFQLLPDWRDAVKRYLAEY